MTARFPRREGPDAGRAGLPGTQGLQAWFGLFSPALALDRLDPAIPDNLVKARLLQAREFFQNRARTTPGWP